jgi:UDP-N-acetylmuramate dehydrogenase
MESGQWGYKKSPFQPGGAYEGAVILGAELSARPGDPQAIFREMEEKRLDRTSKGHYLYPCAGSVFKNDRSFGEPTGAILDKLGFRGKRIGSAAVADFHANIFVNPGKATAADMRALIELAEETAYRERGIRLEREVLLIGDFDEAR